VIAEHFVTMISGGKSSNGSLNARQGDPDSARRAAPSNPSAATAGNCAILAGAKAPFSPAANEEIRINSFNRSNDCDPFHGAAVYSPSILSKFSLMPSNDLNPRSKVTSS
jgi:hypothetical protein